MLSGGSSRVHVGHPVCLDGQRARGAVGEVGTRVEGVGRVPAGDGDGHGGAVAEQPEGIAGEVDRLGEADRQVVADAGHRSRRWPGVVLTTVGAASAATEPCGVSEKSSTASPSSEPVTLTSLQRIHTVAPGREGQAVDRAGQGGPVRSGVAVGGADRGRVRAGEVQGVDVGPGAVGHRRRVGAVLEVQAVGPRRSAHAPLLAGVGDVQRRDGAAGAVGEAGPDGRDQAAALQPTQRALGAGRGAEAVRVTRRARARPGAVRRVGVRAGLGEAHPVGRTDDVPVFARESKFWVYAVSSAVRGASPAAKAG